MRDGLIRVRVGRDRRVDPQTHFFQQLLYVGGQSALIVKALDGQFLIQDRHSNVILIAEFSFQTGAHGGPVEVAATRHDKLDGHRSAQAVMLCFLTSFNAASKE